MVLKDNKLTKLKRWGGYLAISFFFSIFALNVKLVINMEHAKVNIAKSFKEIIDDRGNNFWQIIIVNEKGYKPKKYLCTAIFDKIRDRIVIKLYDKFGRTIGGYYGVPCIYFGYGNKLESHEALWRGRYFTTSQESAYIRCMNNLKDEIKKLRGKENIIHDLIYGL